MNEQALKERLKYIAKTEDCTFGEVWKKLLLERFLSRLSRSKYHDKFIFKGGLLLSYYIDLGRETMDIDFLADMIHGKQDVIWGALKEVSETSINDGFTFAMESIDELDHVHMEYSGYRVSIKSEFGKLKDIIKIDIALGDEVEPCEASLSFFRYKAGPLFEASVSLMLYPVESIFSEKLETIVSRGASNSRMKDFHDVLLICRKVDICDISKLNKSIVNTFDKRGTSKNIPIAFDSEDYMKLQNLWKAHKRGISADVAEQIPDSIQEVVREINYFLHDCLK